MNELRDEIRFIRIALKEDIGKGDITTRALRLKGLTGKAEIISKADGVISGIRVLSLVFRELSESFNFKIYRNDGQEVKSGDRVVAVMGPLDLMLTGERTSMNILCHLSGVATLTRRFTDLIKGHRATLLDTRKTMPGMRTWEKEAVRHGGGKNHRMGLYDMYLIKENHIAAAGGLKAAMEAAVLHRKKTGMKLEVEVRSLDELEEVLPYRPDFILLDNFGISTLKKGVALAKSKNPKSILEASGNVGLGNINKIAAAGVDRISIGRITHSAPALDLSLKVVDL